MYRTDHVQVYRAFHALRVAPPPSRSLPTKPPASTQPHHSLHHNRDSTLLLVIAVRRAPFYISNLSLP
jgi:hypothetical protein